MRPMRIMIVALVVTLLLLVVEGIDTNDVYSPCLDSKIQRSDGFTFGVAFSSKESFFQDQIQFSPCDTRLSLASKMAQLVVFRPKVDQLSFLTINSSTFNPVCVPSYLLSSILFIIIIYYCYLMLYSSIRKWFLFFFPTTSQWEYIYIIWEYLVSKYYIFGT